MERIAEFSQERSSEEFKALINRVEGLLIEEQEAGKGKLGRNIKETVSGPYGNVYFVEEGIAYLPPKGRAVFVGDTHGDSESTQAILKQINFGERVKEDPDFWLVFLGDYADRGTADVKNLLLVLSLKQKYPRNVILLRGNHEHHYVHPRSLPRSLRKAYGIIGGKRLDSRCLSLFRKMPNVLVCGNEIVAVHGGVPSEDIENLFDLKGNERLFNQIRWNDPVEGDLDRISGKRGSPKYIQFGLKAFDKFMEAIGGSVMVRAHEYLGGDWAFMLNDRLLSIFSTGKGSQETGYPWFSTPIFAEFDLTKPITQISQENVHPIHY